MIETEIRKLLFVDHIVLTIRDISATRKFYAEIFGSPDYNEEHFIMYQLGQTKLFLSLPYKALQPGDTFDSNRIGLEHFAIGVLTLDDLKKIQTSLDKSFVKHSGIHVDSDSGKEKIWLDDPNGIRLEFYLRANQLQ